MASAQRRPYQRWFLYLYKYGWSLGERIARGLLLNRFAPRVAGVERGVRYVPGGHRLQSLDIFKPAGEPPFPVLVYMHGSAYHFGDKRTYDRICKCFAHAGFLVFNANYRMAPRWGYPEQLQDTAAAVDWACEHARWYGGDNRRVFLGGDSAGAYFSAAYAVEALDEDLRRTVPIRKCVPAEDLKGLLLFYGAYDCEKVQETSFPLVKSFITGFLGRDRETFKERAEIASPVRHLAAGFPPCYIATSEFDPLHPESVDFIRALEEKGLAYEYLNLARSEFPYTYHGFLNFWFLKSARLAMQGALDFLHSCSVTALDLHMGSGPM